MEVLFVIEPIGITDLTIEWKGELPQVGDEIHITYYVGDEKYEEWYKQIIKESVEISDVERKFLGKSMGHLLDNSTIVVKNRTWVGKEHGCMLNCKII